MADKTASQNQTDEMQQTHARMISTRLATPSDAAQLADLLCQLGYPTTELEALERIIYMNSPGNSLIVVLDTAEPCGLVGVSVFPTVHASGKMAKVTALVVDEARRGRGMGQALLQAAEAFARQEGAVRTEIASGNHRPAAHAFYRGAGYTQTDHSRFVLSW
ncbi:MAG: GNAT family N-acetyltransferase [Burkholderiales bacterium]|nr:GNAT family N-acetyltransferase [Burkholderiales bacterium]